MKIATWNVNSLNVRLPHVVDWLRLEQPDLLALQETKLTDADFPTLDIANAGYHAAFSGQKTYNGVAILSRSPAAGLIADLPGSDDPQRRVLAATVGGVRVLNLYVPNGQSVGSEKYAYKLAWLKQLALWTEQELARHPRLIVLGDFNIAPEDRDVHDPIAWTGQILCSEPERSAFQRLLHLGLQDAFRLFPQEPNTFSWWDYRAAAFRRNLGLRIDHILISPTLAANCVACRVDKTPRKLERPSDHAPVIAEFAGDSH
ncbi:MAG: exodeoxyribonuclease III [Candidatus Competibacteraceae bacterium]|nr:exodeoxyribonuclease III [Candidatus Competibacteraceae bacterium]